MRNKKQQTELLGEAPAFLSVLRAANIVAATDVSVLLQGESGTGKELMAQHLHRESRRAGRPFVGINCAALPEQLAESELFGHRKGAFTGATQDRVGKIQAAANGTLFLDEIGELPLALQAKLLRFLESGECQRLGQAHVEHFDVRIITATNRDLAAAAHAGEFRTDLFYRLNVVPLNLPPLRERPGDIPLLLNALSKQLSAQHGLACPGFQAETMTQLENYDWPGNVRELRNLCERLVIFCPGADIAPSQLPPEIRAKQNQTFSLNLSLPDEGIRLDELEVQLIRQALEKTAGNRSRAAGLLGLTRDTFLYRMKKYALG